MGPTVLCFDLNGTLLDMSVLDPHFGRIFGGGVPAHRWRETWFARLQKLWMTSIAIGEYEPFPKLAKASLQMTAAREGIELKPDVQAAVLEQMTTLPAFPDVAPALARLHEAKFKLVVLTNGVRKSAKAQVKFAGLADLLDQVYTVDQVERYKPAREPYLYVAKQMGVKPKKILMVAAHAWDLAGAAQAGLRTAFVARPRQPWNPNQPKPDYRVQSLDQLADELI